MAQWRRLRLQNDGRPCSSSVARRAVVTAVGCTVYGSVHLRSWWAEEAVVGVETPHALLLRVVLV